MSDPLRGVELGGLRDNKFEAYAHMNEIGITTIACANRKLANITSRSHRKA